MNLEDKNGTDLFEGGFLGLDNIGPLDRSHLPVGGVARAVGRHRLDGLLRAGDGRHRPASSPARASGPPTTSSSSSSSTSPTIREALATLGLWDDEAGLYCDSLVAPDGTVVPVKVRSMVGIIPLLAAVVLDENIVGRAQTLGKGAARLHRATSAAARGSIDQGLLRGEPGQERLLLGVVGVERLRPAVRASCSTSASSSRPTASGRCPPTTATTPTSSRSRA